MRSNRVGSTSGFQSFADRAPGGSRIGFRAFSAAVGLLVLCQLAVPVLAGGAAPQVGEPSQYRIRGRASSRAITGGDLKQADFQQLLGLVEPEDVGARRGPKR